MCTPCQVAFLSVQTLYLYKMPPHLSLAEAFKLYTILPRQRISEDIKLGSKEGKQHEHHKDDAKQRYRVFRRAARHQTL